MWFQDGAGEPIGSIKGKVSEGQLLAHISILQAPLSLSLNFPALDGFKSATSP